MEEVKRLEDTSDEGEYVIDKLSARMSDFNTMNMTITLDLMNCLTDWLSARIIERAGKPDCLEKSDRITHRSLTECASIIDARNQWLEKQGISLDDYDRFNSPASPMLAELIKRSEGHQELAMTTDYLAAIESYFKNRYPS